MRFSIGENVIVSEIPEIKRKLRGKRGQILGITRKNARVRIASGECPEEYNFFEDMIRKQGEPFGSNELERRVKYLDHSGEKCPFCESNDIYTARIWNEAGSAWADVECRECGKSWREIYKLVHYDEIITATKNNPAEQHNHKVVVEVYGGIAEVMQCPDGVEVEIIDHDNIEAERAI